MSLVFYQTDDQASCEDQQDDPKDSYRVDVQTNYVSYRTSDSSVNM